MGAWGNDSFENDEACDWAGEMLRKKSVAFVEKTLRKVVRNDDYIESDDGSAAIAAAEVIARARGHFGQRDAYTEKLNAWISKSEITFSQEIEELALKALEQVTSEESELRELWEDAGADALREWLDKVEQLKTRVAAKPS